MKLFNSIKDFFMRLFSKSDDTLKETIELEAFDDVALSVDNQIEKFKMNNVILEKIKFLEQYIKIFSLNYPNEYAKFCDLLKEQKNAYYEELESYKKGFEGHVIFSIDPEMESNRHLAISNLENSINNFVNDTVYYNNYKNKFSKLCYKFTAFYEALIGSTRAIDQLSNQLSNAINALYSLVDEVKVQLFFIKDSRKKEEILNYIIYCDYIIFKSSFRCNLVLDYDDFISNKSRFHCLFIDIEYDKLIFKSFIDCLEQYQVFITQNLSLVNTYNLLINNCQELQNKLKDYSSIFHNREFFVDLIKFENTVNNFSKSCDLTFSYKTNFINYSDNNDVKTNKIALCILDSIESEKTWLVSKIISNFKYEISWREFYFLCKIFEVYDQVLDFSSTTIFEVVKNNFLRISETYSDYSDSVIQSKKQKLLNYNGSKQKKYILLLEVSKDEIEKVCHILDDIYLDYTLKGNNVFLNHSYFNGFKNLEKNFGSYQIL